jgi:hypothetical protein
MIKRLCFVLFLVIWFCLLIPLGIPLLLIDGILFIVTNKYCEVLDKYLDAPYNLFNV